MQRRIAELEKDYVDANMAIYARFCVKDKFSSEIIEKALSNLLEKHPLLRSIVSNNSFIERSPFDVSDYLLEKSIILDNETLFSYILDPAKELFKVYFCKKENKTDFLFILHHSIADGKSSLMAINDFVKWLYFPNFPISRLSMPPSAEFFFDLPSQEDVAQYASELKKLLASHPPVSFSLDKPQVSYDQLSAAINFFVFPKQKVLSLLRFAKKLRVTLNSLITAMFIKSLNLEGVICVGAAVNLRKRLKVKISEGLITAPVGAFIFLDIKSSDGVEKIAKSYQEKLLSHINSPKLLLQHYAILRKMLNPMDFKPLFFLSNVGQASFLSDISNKILNVSLSAKVLTNFPFITCVTHQKMSLTITFPQPWISVSLIKSMINSILLE